MRKRYLCRERSLIEIGRLGRIPPQFLNFFAVSQADALEVARKARCKAGFLSRLVFHRIPKNIPYLFLHAAAVLLRALLQARFDVSLEIADDKLSHLLLR